MVHRECKGEEESRAECFTYGPLVVTLPSLWPRLLFQQGTSRLSRNPTARPRFLPLLLYNRSSRARERFSVAEPFSDHEHVERFVTCGFVYAGRSVDDGNRGAEISRSTCQNDFRLVTLRVYTRHRISRRFSFQLAWLGKRGNLEIKL